jgi:hypothetical protein
MTCALEMLHMASRYVDRKLVLDSLVEVKFLCRKPHGAYARRTAERSPAMMNLLRDERVITRTSERRCDEAAIQAGRTYARPSN